MPTEVLNEIVEAVYWLAGALALAGALTGNRVAWPLLASFAFRQVANWRGWDFDENLWATVDYCALFVILMLKGWNSFKPDWTVTRGEVWIVLLFAPMLASYKLDGEAGYLLSMACNIAQLTLVFPALKAWAWLRRTHQLRDGPDMWDDFDLRAAHCEAGG